jgi:hypothetical protein
LKKARFWYSQVVLTQALSVAGRRCPDERKEIKKTLRRVAGDVAEHPFVRRTARLSLRAMRSDWRSIVWEDESSAIAQGGGYLSDRTNLLMSDIVLLLNLTEQDDYSETYRTEDERMQALEERKEAAFVRNDLPFCLARSKDRRELFETCRCHFKLCPYPSPTFERLARGEFSEAFCRHMAQTYGSGAPTRTLLRGARPLTWSGLRRRAMRRFWEDMGRRAR